MRRICLALVATVVMVSALPAAAATSSTPQPISPFHGHGPTVVQLGDSLARSAQPVYLSRARSSFSSSVNNYAGYSMREHVGRVHTASLLNPRAIVIALGTNDARHTPSPATDGTWERAFWLVRTGRPDCTVVVKPYLGRSTTDRRRRFWGELEPLVARYGIRVYDWNAVAQASPHYIGADDEHFTMAGADAYAYALIGANRLCTG